MSVEHVEILVEEPSMEAALRIILPRILGGLSFAVYPHQCKQELLARLPQRLRGYSLWIQDNYRIVVVVDRDGGDCLQLKNKLEQSASDVGLITKSAATGPFYIVVNRIVIEELEAWYFGDWAAVLEAYPRVPSTIPQKAPFRDPDAIRGGTWEAFERVLQKAGYFKGGLRKIEAARAIAPYWDPARNTSASFQTFRHAIEDIAGQVISE